MTFRSAVLFVAVLLGTSLGAQAPPGTDPPPGARVLLAPVVVDSVFITGTFTMPPADTKGAIDSVRVDISGLMSPVPFRTWRPAPLPLSVVPYTFHLLAPPAQPGSATYNIFATVWTFRRGLVTAVSSPKVPLVIADSAPAGVTGNAITVATWP